MDVTKNANVNDDMDTICAVLESLKKQVDQYAFTVENMRLQKESMRNQRIEKLIMEEKRLSIQFDTIKKEIKRYEEKYEKALKRKVKLMKMQIDGDRDKLDVLKEKCKELKSQLTVSGDKRNTEKKSGRKRKKKVLGLKTMKLKFKQRSRPVKTKIRIKLKQNPKLGKRDMIFLNNGGNSLTKLVEAVPPDNLNTRECKIMLQRLTDKQMKQYVMEKSGYKQRQKEAKQKLKVSPQTTGVSEVEKVNKNWQIRIPMEVLEESKVLNESTDLYTSFTSDK